MGLRDQIEEALRAWDAYEINRGHNPVIDFDCHPITDEVTAAPSRLDVYRRLTELRRDATGVLARRLDADLAYLGALLGERPQFDQYVRATQGCTTSGWSEDYLAAVEERARASLAAFGIPWGESTFRDLNETEGPIPVEEAAEAIRAAATTFEPLVREATGSTAPYELTVETTKVDAYWAFWVDGTGSRVRLRLNEPNISFTNVTARQMALHEVLGHGLQGASYHQRTLTEDVPWVRLLSVHAPQQVLLEGLAQALPLFITPDDTPLIARLRFVHYTQLVRAEIHRNINLGIPALDCADQARTRAPWWDDTTISNLLTDRGANPQLRSYLWSYPAGLDWFTNLADHAPLQTVHDVLHASYQAPLNPTDLTTLWPQGPSIGG